MNQIERCIWQKQKAEDEGLWKTDCDNFFFFADSSPSENDMKYCCYCGRKIEERQICGKLYTEQEH